MLLDKFLTKKDFDYIISDMKDSINAIWIITASCNIIAIQLGFSLLEVGSIHHKNTTNILYKNLVDTFFGALGFYMFGYAFANEAQGGLFGYWKFFCKDLTREEYIAWLFQFSFCSTSATIVSGGLAERTYIEPYMLFSFLVGAFVYPIASSWVWGNGWL